MGTSPGREPSPLGSTDACRDLAQHLRFMLDREGVTPRQLADSGDVPYSVTMIYRFLSGETLPPPRLVEIIARRCGTDPEALRIAYERARQATMLASGLRTGSRMPRHARGAFPPADAVRTGPKHARRRGKRAQGTRPAGRRRITVGVGFSAAGALVLAATAINGFGLGDGSPIPLKLGADVQPPNPAAAPDGTAGGAAGGPQAPLAARPEAKRYGQRASKPPRVDDGGQLVRNGSFTRSTSPWFTSGEARLRVDKRRMRISVAADRDGELRDTVVKQRIPALRDDRRYVLCFRAAADSPMTIKVTVQRESSPFARTLSEEIELDNQMRPFRFAFTSELANSRPLVTFQLGGQSDMHTVWVDGVVLQRK